MDNRNPERANKIELDQLPMPQFDASSDSLVQNSAPESGVGLWNENNIRNIGNSALGQGETAANADLEVGGRDNPSGDGLASELLGKDENLSAAQTNLETSPSLSEKTAEQTKIKTTETLSRDAVKAIDQAKTKFYQDGNAADFYEKYRNYMEENLKNSYDRELGK